MFVFTCEGALKAHLKHNVPAGMWCTNSRNGVTAVAHYRAFVQESVKVQRYLTPGHNEKFFKLSGDQWDGFMCFSDRAELYSDDTTFGRRAPELVGNMAEFRRFCDHFPVVQAPLYVPSGAAELTSMIGRGLGDMKSPEDFTRVIAYAKEIVQESKRQIG
jgi:hypothetical protein